MAASRIFLSVQFLALERSIGFLVYPGASFQLGSTLQARALPSLGFEFPRVSFPRRGLAQRGPLRHMVTSIPSPPFSRRLFISPFSRGSSRRAGVAPGFTNLASTASDSLEALPCGPFSASFFSIPDFRNAFRCRLLSCPARGAFPRHRPDPNRRASSPMPRRGIPRQRLVAASRRVRQSTQKGCGSPELS
jgi:hypothetical protein